ncbi:MAG: MMPL family transporter [Wenzhouxiangellaceae bacterium]
MSNAKRMHNTPQSGFAAGLRRLIFSARPVILLAFAVGTVAMLFFASQLRVDAGFKKQIPLEHEYMQTFEFYEQFGGANRLLVALQANDGDIFDADYFAALEELTERVTFIDGVDRATVRSIFTPNVRFIEVVEGGFSGGNVIPSDFQPTAEDFRKVRANIVKSGEIGRLITNDFSGAMIWANLVEEDPLTGEKIDYQRVAADLEQLRSDFENEDHGVHIIGFAKIVGDIAEGAKSVILFFGVAIVITLLLLWFYARSLALAIAPMVCALVAVIWSLGGLRLMGFGIDPMNILTPFLIFAIGVSHGVQMISAFIVEKFFNGISPTQCLDDGIGLDELPIDNSLNAAGNAFSRLLAPGSIALLSDTIGFMTVLLIDIRIIQELAITASVGVAIIIFTNLVLLPVILSYLPMKKGSEYQRKAYDNANKSMPIWRWAAQMARPGPARAGVAIAVVLFAFGYWKSQGVQIGDSESGVPELREDARYNQDARYITENFALGVDQIGVIAETAPQSCTENHEVMRRIDEFAWLMSNVEGVQKVLTLPMVAKIVNAGWNEGNPEWRILSSDPYIMRQAVSGIETSTGLLNADCSAMPVLIFTEDHRAETITRVVSQVKELRMQYNLLPEVTGMDAGDPELIPPDVMTELNQISDNVCQDANGEDCLRLRLATGNVGVMAAVNEVVSRAQTPMLLWVYAAIVVLCLLTFRSIVATLAIVLPLALVSYLAYAFMAWQGIGLKVNTLPVVALGVGIGVDYGIYLYSRLQDLMQQGLSLTDAYYRALRLTGRAVVFTAVTLAVGVGTWLFSDLQFQADMGLLLAFFFLLNMLAAIVLLPAICQLLLPARVKNPAG